MKKYAIVLLTFAVAFGAYFFAFRYGHAERVERLARELVMQRTSELIIGPHPALNDRLAELGVVNPADYEFSLISGDAPSPIGDGRATHHFFIVRRTDGQRLVGVRLRYEAWRKKYHVVGYWTP